MATVSEIKEAKLRFKARLERYKSGAILDINETKEEKQERIEKAKKSFKFFVSYYFSDYAIDSDGNVIETPDFHVNFANRVKRDKTVKAIQRWGRAQAKSVVSDLLLPMWLWINKDINYMVQIGNNLDKAKILIADLQAEFSNPRIVYDFGIQKTLGSWEKGYFITKSGFTCKAFGMGQDVRGLRMKNKRPDYIAADDLEDKDTLRNPKKQDEIANWLLTSVIPTMDGSRRRFIMAGNRFAPRMIQTVLEELMPTWYVHEIDAYDIVTYKPAWNSKYTADYWRQIEKEIGILAARAEYCNIPHVEGKIFKKEQIQWGERPKLNHFKVIVGHWDIAYAGTKTSDFNAVRLWGLYNPIKRKDIAQFWYIDSFVQQTKMKEAVEWMCLVQLNLPDSVKVHWRFESQFWNDEVKRTIKEAEKKYSVNLNIVKVDTPKTKKYDRIITLQSYYQNSRLFYAKDKKAHNDTIEGLEQLYGIEPGYRTHDDAPDADEQCIKYLEKHIRSSGRTIRSGKYKSKRNKRGYR